MWCRFLGRQHLRPLNSFRTSDVSKDEQCCVKFFLDPGVVLAQFRVLGFEGLEFLFHGSLGPLFTLSKRSLRDAVLFSSFGIELAR